MEVLYDVLRYLGILAFVLLAIVTYRQWLERRDEPSSWVVLTFASLGTAAFAGLLLPEESDSPTIRFLETVLAGLLLLFPYFLFRLATFFSESPSRRINLGAAALTAIVILWAALLPRFPEPGEERSTAFQIFVIVVLLQWVTLSAFVALRFWRAGANQPDVARRRMRTLSIAATSMSVTIVLAGADADRSTELDVFVQALALASAVTFFLAFSPPAWLRWLWRRKAEREIREATSGLLSAGTREEIVDTVLSRAAGIVGGRAIAMFDTGSNLLGVYGFDEEELEALDPSADDVPGERVSLQYPFGCLIVRTSVHTPFFGEEDINLLGDLGTLSNLALQRLDAAETERLLAEARLRQRQALEINDNVVQRLAVAHYSFELGQVEEGKKAMQAALRAARRTISDLLDELPPGQQVDPSTLTRKAPASE